MVLDGDTKVTLSWIDRSADETEFRIEGKIGAGAYGYLDSALPSPGVGHAVMFELTGLTAQTDYTIRVYAIGDFGSTEYSNEVAATTGPIAPDGLVVTPSPGQADLSWNDNSTGESGFDIERSLDNVVYSYIGSVGANVTVYNNPVSANTYYYRVYATSPNSNSSAAVDGPVVIPPP
jgi:hypothetical protein